MVDDPLRKLGETFKNARLQLGISLEDLAQKTKIKIHYLENIEKANRSQLPEEAYLLGYLNKLAKSLNLKDPQKIIDEYKNSEGSFILQNILNENHIKDSNSSYNMSSLRIFHVYLFLVVIVVGALLYLFFSPKNSVDDKSPTVTASKQKK
jgi:cytoskeletal protein RodZ